jgi:hypothetical protein
MDFLCAGRQLRSRSRFSASEIEMRNKTQIQKVSGQPTRKASGQPSSLAPEISLIAFLTAMLLLRVLDICSTASVDPACTPTTANRAAISCATRPDQGPSINAFQAASIR